MAAVPALDFGARELDALDRWLADDHAREVDEAAAAPALGVGEEHLVCGLLLRRALARVERGAQRGLHLLVRGRVPRDTPHDLPDEKAARERREPRAARLAPLPHRVAQRDRREARVDVGAHRRGSGFAHPELGLERRRAPARAPRLIELVGLQARRLDALVPPRDGDGAFAVEATCRRGDGTVACKLSVEIA